MWEPGPSSTVELDEMTDRLRTLALTLSLLALSVIPCLAGDVPWDRIAGAAALNPSQRQAAEAVLRGSLCYGGCAGTVLDCMQRGDPIGARVAAFIVRRAAAGDPADRITAAVDKRRLSATVADTAHVDLSGMFPSGDPHAPVQVIIYGDFDCPFCRTAATTVRELSLKSPAKVALWFKNFPLAQDDRALPAAVAYLAADRQGRGWEMFDGLFANTTVLNDDALNSIADGTGMDMAQFHADLEDPKLVARVRAEKAEGERCGFDRVPGILVNGKAYLGPKTKVEILDRIAEEEELVARRAK